MNLVKKNITLHNSSSTLLIGNVKKGDIIKESVKLPILITT